MSTRGYGLACRTWRLFRYISGANEGDADRESATAGAAAEGTSIPMIAPVEVAGRGRSIAMTAPVEAAEEDEGVRMAFYLPATYDAESAPRPTDAAVDLVAVPERTLAARRFS